MKTLQSSILRALVAIAVGVLLVTYREHMMTWITIAAGTLFFLSGAVACVTYYWERRRIEKAVSHAEQQGLDTSRLRKPFFPIVGVGSIILGIILALMPNDFITGVAYVLAGILILGALNQLFSLFSARRYGHIPAFFWVFPLITLAIGVWVMQHPMKAAALPLQVIGWCMMFYGVIECVNAMKIHRDRKAYDQAQADRYNNGQPIEDAEIVEE